MGGRLSGLLAFPFKLSPLQDFSNKSLVQNNGEISITTGNLYESKVCLQRQKNYWEKLKNVIPIIKDLQCNPTTSFCLIQKTSITLNCQIKPRLAKVRYLAQRYLSLYDDLTCLAFSTSVVSPPDDTYLFRASSWVFVLL